MLCIAKNYRVTASCILSFAVLLSLELDGFDQLIKLFLHCPCCQLTRQHKKCFLVRISSEKNSGAVIQTRAAWAWSVNASSVLWRPPCSYISLLAYLRR